MGGAIKNVIVEDGNTLINCLAYIDLNPVRAGMVEMPEDYRWNSIGYFVQTKNNEVLTILAYLNIDYKYARIYRPISHRSGESPTA